MMKFDGKEILTDFVVPFVTFVLGIIISFLLSRFVPDSETKLIRKNKSNGYYQSQIKQLPYIQSFFEYLTFIENKDTLQIWNHMTHDYQNSFGYSGNLKYAYYLTNNYDVKYIIPISENHFYVFLRFEDDVIGKEVENIKKYNNTQITKLNTDSFPPALQTEIYQFIENRFIVDNPDEVRNEIGRHLSKMTIRDFVTQDWRFPLNIASKLHLAPRHLNRSCYDYRQGHDMISEVIMEKEDGMWKVKKFETIAISRWK